MSQVVTLAERHRRKMEAMRRAIEEVDALLTHYARQNGGRFIRYGSTATGRAMAHSDVDIIADFSERVVFEASNYAEDLCCARNLKPDIRPSCYVSEKFLMEAAADGIVLA